MRMHRKILKHLEHHGLDPNVEYIANESGDLVPRFETAAAVDSESESDLEESQGTFDEDSKFTVPEVAKTVVESLDQSVSTNPSEAAAPEKKTTKRKPPPPKKKKAETPSQI